MIIKKETTSRLQHPLFPAKRMTRTRKMKTDRRRHHASKEMVRRALTPPARRLTWRWFDFRPTPSRLSVMSMASS
ncbi:hypothetical protein HanIR_Chr05g0249871 [Helianthus annuus]|nr:hypothetical protein HanIR_Chr05g0249871 [Helianthus annuus]